MIKENLSIKERFALGQLVKLCKHVNLLVEDEGDPDWLITNGNTLDLDVFEKEDWETCLKALE